MALLNGSSKGHPEFGNGLELRSSAAGFGNGERLASKADGRAGYLTVDLGSRRPSHGRRFPIEPAVLWATSLVARCKGCKALVVQEVPKH